MVEINKTEVKNVQKYKITWIITILLVIIFFVFNFLWNHESIIYISNSSDVISTSTDYDLGSQSSILSPNPITNSQSIPSSDMSNNIISSIYPTKEGGRVWYSKWSNRKAKTLSSSERDPYDQEFVLRGDGIAKIDGDGIIHLEGDSPRMYVFDPKKVKKWEDVEVTVYAKRVSEYGPVSSQGIVIGARSEHQDATLQNPCLGATYYGRVLYDGRAGFQKEVIHEGVYSSNKPSESNKIKWGTPDGTMPVNKWIGVKFIVKNNPDGKSVKLELYIDLTDGYNGGIWKKVAEYVDNGNWYQNNSPDIDVVKECGYSSNKVLLNPGTSVFIRNDEIKEADYKLFKIKSI